MMLNQGNWKWSWGISMVLVVFFVCSSFASGQEPREVEISGKVMMSPKDCFAHGQKPHVHKGGRMQYAISPDGSSEILNLVTDEDLSDLTPGQKIKVRGQRRGRAHFKARIVTRGSKKTETASAATSEEATAEPVSAEAGATPRTVLVVRVIAADGATTKSMAQLSDDVFGTSGDPINLVERFNTISYGKTRFAPATGTNITNGVCEVTISDTVAGTDRGTIQNAVLQAGETLFGKPLKEVADHTMLALPAGTAGSWIAYAFTDDYLTVYNDLWASYVSAQVHELGHNLNLAHAWEGNVEYDDQQGYMGYSYSSDDGPLMGFNAAKSWQMGWYSDKSQAISASESWSGKLIGFADYGTTATDQSVILKIAGGSEDLFLTYNRKTGMNGGTQEAGDFVTVVKQGNAGSRSWLMAKIPAGSSAVVDVPGMPGATATIQFNGTGTADGVQYANVDVGATVPLRDPDNPPGLVAGIGWERFLGTWDLLPDFNALTADARGVTTTFQLGLGEPADSFAYRFTGYVDVPTDGVYTFYTSSDDGSKLYIGDSQIVDNDGLHGMRERRGGIGLKAGKHAISVTYFEKSSGEGLTVSWAGPGITKQALPASALKRLVIPETVWVEDVLPAGAVAKSSGGDTWNWISSGPTPYSGTVAHQSALVEVMHQHYFESATDTMTVYAGDTLFAYVYLDPDNLPSEIMLQWNDGSWDHRAYWGENLLDWGTNGTASRRYMGPLPAAGQWVRLEVPASQVGMEYRTATGMAFTLYGGRATWDRAGRCPANTAPVANDDSVTTEEDVPVAITLSAADAEGDPLSYSVVTGPANGTLSGTAPDLTYTPNANFSGSDSFTFKANDGELDSYNVATVSITVNNAPTVDAGLDQTVAFNGGAPWTPADIATDLWLDADDAGTLTESAGAISQWNDKSGNARNATQGTVANRPAATSAGLNGKTVVTFDGATSFFNVDLDFLAGVSHSAFIVTKATTYTDIYGAANASAGAYSLHVGFNNSTYYRMNYWGNDWYGTIGAAFQSGQANILNYVWTSGASKEVFANGTSEGSNPSAGVIGTMSGGGRIGQVVNHGYYGGDIAEVIMITGSVTLDNRQNLEGYLAHKWGIEGYLPAAHPHKASAPVGTGVRVNLDGSATDADDDPLTTVWTVVSTVPDGLEGTVTFADASASVTTATFTTVGVYTLRLTANDGNDTAYDECVITVSTGDGPIADATLPAGISLYGYTGANPIDTTVAFQGLIDNNQLSLVRWVNPMGSVRELYYTTFPSAGWVNEIGNLTLGEGYVVKTSSACTLSITGTKSTANVIHDLRAGYSIIGYNKETPINAQTAFQPLIDANKLELVRWVDPSTGGIKEIYYTTFPSPGWINEIGDLTEGQGYIIKLNAPYSGFALP